MNEETEELLKEIKAYRNDMVAKNYPYQQISDIITKWEIKKKDYFRRFLQMSGKGKKRIRRVLSRIGETS